MRKHRPDLEEQVIEKIPKSQKVFGSVVYWIAIFISVAAMFVPVFILADPAGNLLNPNLIFGAIFEGATPDEIWGYSVSGGFPGAHFYLEYITKADSWAMLLVAIGCGFALLGFIPAIIHHIKEKDWFCVIFATLISAFILLSVTGTLSI